MDADLKPRLSASPLKAKRTSANCHNYFEVSSTLAKLEDSVSKAVSHFTLEIVQPRVISFEDQVGSIRYCAS